MDRHLLHQHQKKGHGIVVANRDPESDIKNPYLWGKHYFIMDLWYYNLGLKSKEIWTTNDERLDYITKEIIPYKNRAGGPEIMATLNG